MRDDLSSCHDGRRRFVTIPVLVVAWFLACVMCGSALASPFDIDGRPARRAIVMGGERALPECCATWIPESAMLRARLRIVAVLEGAAVKSLDEATVPFPPARPPGSTPPTAPTPSESIVLHTVYLDGPTARRDGVRPAVVIERAGDGTLRARAVGAGAGPGGGGAGSEPPMIVDPAAWAALTRVAAAARDPRAAIDAAVYPPGEIASLAQPYTPSPFTMDRAGLADRLNGGSTTSITPENRDLATEQIFVRVPRVGEGPEGVMARGLLLWVDASPSGQPPEALFEAADALNLVIVGPANCGNDRDVSNRMQVCLDAVATAMERLPLDAERVYVTGISGGGRISSMLHICFPDLFTGSAPIVGVNYYGKLPTGDGKMWPQSMVKPSAKRWAMLKEQRIGPISGPPDFNYEQTRVTVERFKADGLDARFFSYEDQAHTMPTAARFHEVMSWVDEAAAARRGRAESEAKGLVDAVERALGDGKPEERVGKLTTAALKRLDRACEIAPWTEAAERAVRLMGLGEGEKAGVGGGP